MNYVDLMEEFKRREIELDDATKSLYLSYMEKREGEIADDELSSVSGGGCRTDVAGAKKVVVSCGCHCFTGQYELNFDPALFKDVDIGRIGAAPVPLPNMSYVPLHTKDNKELRMLWSTICGYGDCGSCSRLSFKGGLGYCSVN